MINVPKNLAPYVEFGEGKILAVNLPAELKEEFAALKKAFERMQADEFTDY